MAETGQNGLPLRSTRTTWWIFLRYCWVFDNKMERTAPPGMYLTCLQVRFLTLSAAAGYGGNRLYDRRSEKNNKMDTSFRTCRVVLWHQVGLGGALEKTRLRRMVGVTGRV